MNIKNLKDSIANYIVRELTLDKNAKVSFDVQEKNPNWFYLSYIVECLFKAEKLLNLNFDIKLLYKNFFEVTASTNDGSSEVNHITIDFHTLDECVSKVRFMFDRILYEIYINNREKYRSESSKLDEIIYWYK